MKNKTQYVGLLILVLWIFQVCVNLRVKLVELRTELKKLVALHQILLKSYQEFSSYAFHFDSIPPAPTMMEIGVNGTVKNLCINVPDFVYILLHSDMLISFGRAKMSR